LSISRKCLTSETPVKIHSAFYRESLKGWIYLESYSEAAVRTALHGLVGIYLNTPRNSNLPSAISGIPGVHLIPLEERPDLLRTKRKEPDLAPGGWVRIRRGKNAGDLAQIVEINENPEEARVKFIPRIDLTSKEEDTFTASDGRKRKKGQSSVPIGFRPPQRFFNPDEVRRVYGAKSVAKSRNMAFVFQNDEYKDGYVHKDVKLAGLIIEDVNPTIDEITQFTGDPTRDEDRLDGAAGSNLGLLAEAAKRSNIILQPGDRVEVFEGDQKGVCGVVNTLSNDLIFLTPDANLHPDLAGTNVEVAAKSVRKRFSQGDHVKVLSGAHADETGLVIKVENDVITFISDLSQSEVTVFSKDVREAAEVGSGVNVIGNFELHDMVQLE
jgi:transcription elongation factor SPT5